MPFDEEEKEWIRKHLDNADDVLNSRDQDFIIDVLNSFTVSELYDNDLSPTQACREAEDIIEHVARFWEK